MTGLTIFNFQSQQVRTAVIEGEPWFVASDVLNLLDLNRSSVSLLDDDEKGVHSMDTRGGEQKHSFVTEAGLWSLVLRSRKPQAKEIKRWLTHEVLPSIRKTGSYGVQQLTGPELIAAALIEAQRTLDNQAKEIEAQKPKVLFADAVATSDTTILVGDLAKILRGNGVDIGANRLFERLREDGYLIKRKGSDWNMPTQYAMDLELFKVKETAVTHSDGHVTVSKTPKITGKGQAFFVNKYAGRELIA